MSEKTNVPYEPKAPSAEELAKLQADYNAAEAQVEAASKARNTALQAREAAAKALNEALTRKRDAK